MESREDIIRQQLREKAIRDRKWELDSARQEGEIRGRKEGEIQGEIRGRKEGEIQGEIRGRKEGEIQGEKRDEIRGRKEGKIRFIHAFQDLLGLDQSPAAELAAQSLEDLQLIAADLQTMEQNRR